MIGEPQGCLPGQGVLFVDIEARLAINVVKGILLKAVIIIIITIFQSNTDKCRPKKAKN